LVVASVVGRVGRLVVVVERVVRSVVVGRSVVVVVGRVVRLVVGGRVGRSVVVVVGRLVVLGSSVVFGFTQPLSQ